MIQKQDLRYYQEKQILVASIDIGTNSTHLLVAEINLELKSFSINLLINQPLVLEKEMRRVILLKYQSKEH